MHDGWPLWETVASECEGVSETASSYGHSGVGERRNTMQEDA